MRRSRHASEDGSFGRSAGMAAGRGAALLAVAVVLGIVLLNAADDPPAEVVATVPSDDDGGEAATSTTQAPTTLAPAPLRAPKDVKVISANGTTVKGVARKVTDQLKAAGYNVLAPTDAPQRAQASVVYFAGDFEREAKALGESLGLPVTAVQALPAPPPLPDTRGANVVVVVGPELAQRLATTATTAATNPAAGPTTPTTAAVTTTTKR